MIRQKPAFERFARVRSGEDVSYAGLLDDERCELLDGTPFTELRGTGQFRKLSDLVLLAPVEPTKIVGVGANYPGDEAAGSRQHPSIFLMPPSAILASGQPIVLPKMFGAVLAEGELALIVGRRARNVSATDAKSFVLGFSIANDLSGRDSSLESVPAAAKKGSDGFLPFGPYVKFGSDPGGFQITTHVNGVVMQTGNSSDMIFGAFECLSFVSMFMTLEPGDVISLGTPPPKPKLTAGDTVTVSIENIGSLTNTVTQA